MVQLICALGFRVDFEMFNDNFYRAIISEEESAYFVNMKGHLFCVHTQHEEGRIKKKSFRINFFESVPTNSLVKKYNKLMEETPWLYT